MLQQNFNWADNRRIYNTLVMLAYLMDSMGPNSWKQRLYDLFNKHPNVRNSAMGFPPDWTDMPIWQDTKA